MARISENDLIIPALKLLSRADNKTLTTTELINQLTTQLNPQGEDLEILRGRNDTKFSQKVRNLKSHDSITNKGYAIYTPPAYKGASGSFTLTSEGEKNLERHQ